MFHAPGQLATHGPRVARGDPLPSKPAALTEDTLPITSETRTRLDRMGLEFLADVLGMETRARPANAAALVTLGMVLTQLGRYAEGLAVDSRLVELAPEDSTARYNLACSLALLGRREEALVQLELAVRCGYDDAAHLAADPDFASLRDDPQFQALLAALAAR